MRSKEASTEGRYCLVCIIASRRLTWFVPLGLPVAIVLKTCFLASVSFMTWWLIRLNNHESGFLLLWEATRSDQQILLHICKDSRGSAKPKTWCLLLDVLQEREILHQIRESETMNEGTIYFPLCWGLRQAWLWVCQLLCVLPVIYSLPLAH